MAGEPYRQTVPGIDLAVERATARVPDQRHYFVFRGGEILGKHKTLKQATTQFRQTLKVIGWNPEPSKARPRDPATEAVERYMDTLEAYWEAAATHRRRGGKTMYRS